MSTTEKQAVQNPFRIAYLKQAIEKLSEAERIVDYVRNVPFNELSGSEEEMASLKCMQALSSSLSKAVQSFNQARMAKLIAEMALAVEQSGVRRHRFFGFKQMPNHDEYWRRWIVLDLQYSAELLGEIGYLRIGGQALHSKEAARILGSVWSSFGFDPYETEPSEVSPTGRMFRRRLCWKLSSGHIVLVQSGGRDV